MEKGAIPITKQKETEEGKDKEGETEKETEKAGEKEVKKPNMLKVVKKLTTHQLFCEIMRAKVMERPECCDIMPQHTMRILARKWRSLDDELKEKLKQGDDDLLLMSS